MNNYIVDLYNDSINEGDTLYNLGDIMLSDRLDDFKRIYQNMKHKMEISNNILILGNHDYLKPWSYLDLGYQSVHTSLEIRVGMYSAFDGTLSLILAHDPAVAACIGKNKILICGHVHQLYKYIYNEENNILIINVCLDVWNNKFVSLEDIRDIVNSTSFH
jgi:calcineurin-like phosphoesterase family protein